MSVNLIVAMSGLIIGKGNNLPWPRIKEDMRWFRKQTIGHSIIMGRKTFESIGKPLPGRNNIVISRQSGFPAVGCKVVDSFENALELALERDSDPFIIGGAQIYRQALPFTDRIFLTEVKNQYEGDIAFPSKLTPEVWSRELIKDTDLASFFILRRLGA